VREPGERGKTRRSEREEETKSKEKRVPERGYLEVEPKNVLVSREHNSNSRTAKEAGETLRIEPPTLSPQKIT